MTFVLVMPLSQKDPLERITSILVMPKSLQRSTFLLVMPKSQKVPTRMIYVVLVMSLSQKDALERITSTLVMPKSLQMHTRKNHVSPSHAEVSKSTH